MTQIIPAGRRATRLRVLALWLGLVAFFQAFAAAATAVAVPHLGSSLRIAPSDREVVDVAVFVVGLGAVLGFFVAASSDRVGRRRLLLMSTALFAILTGSTSIAGDLALFQMIQFLAHIFLTSAYVVAIAMVAEEFPAARRGRAMGSLTAAAALGASVALLHPVGWDDLIGYRSLYVIGSAPILLVLFAAKALPETSPFIASLGVPAPPGGSHRSAIRRVFHAAYRVQLFQVGALFFCAHFALLGTVTWWAYFASRDRDLSTRSVSAFLLAAYLAGAAGSYLAGRLLDGWGRRSTGTLYLLAASVTGIAVFRARGSAMLFVTLTMTVFFGLGVSSVGNAYASELFPTHVRATAIGFCRAIFGTFGGILGPLFVGLITSAEGAGVGEVGWLVALAYLPAAVIIRLLPETAGRTLEDIAAATEIPSRVPAPYL